MAEADICVVGGGIAGLTLSRVLAGRGAEVILLEKAGVGEGTSKVAAGMLAPLVEARLAEREIVRFGGEALRFWEDFAPLIEEEAGYGIDYRREGTLVVAVERDHLGMIGHLRDEQRELGLVAEELSGAECRKLEPALAPSVYGGFFSPNDHQVDNRRLLLALREICVEKGVQVLENCEGVSLEREGNRWRIGTTQESVTCNRLVIATGSSLSLLREIAPDLSRLVRPVKGQILRVDQSGMPLVHHVIRTPDIYFAPKSDGMLVVGASSEDRGFDSALRIGPLYETLQAAWETLPGLYELPLVESLVGFRPASLDHAPLLGETSLEGVYLATGYYRHGILFAPLAAELLADYILEGNLDERIRPFQPERFNRVQSER